MQQTLTAKLQIFPKPSDRQLLFDTTKAYSAACTYVSDYVHANHTPLNIFRIQKATYQTCRESFGLRSQMAVSVTRTVIAAYKSVRTNQRQHSGRFSKKKRHIDIKPSFRAPQLSLVWNRDYSLIKNTDKTERLFSVNTLRGRIKCPFRADSMDWAFDEGAVYGTAKLIFRHGKFFLYVPVTINVPDTPAPSSCKKVVGIDRGIRFLAVACDGKKSGHVDRASRKHETHTFKCTACGYTTNDDRIGAMNLQRMGTEYLLKAQVSDI